MPKHNRERIVSSINGAGKMDIHLDNNEVGPLSYTIHKNQFKVDERNVRCKIIKIPEENRGKNFIILPFAMISWMSLHQSTSTIAKIDK